MAGNSTEDLFGNNALFQQFENGSRSSSEESDEEDSQTKDKVEEYEEEISNLRRENQQLKQKLRLLIKSSNAVIDNAGRDGPIAQVVYMNNDLIKIHQQDIEEFMIGLAYRGQQLSRDGTNTDKMQPYPQNSAIVLEKDQKTTDSSVVKSRQAFTAIGNVQYYSDFCIDQLGKPLIDWNPQLTLCWDIPTYTQVFMDALPVEDDGSKPKRKPKIKATCFNCGSEDHSLRECTQPRDMAKINQNRQMFMTQFGNSPRSSRYHKDGEELVKKFPNVKPGVISDSLREALGIGNQNLPPYIYQMRIHGYPPGYLKEAEEVSSGLTMYNQHGKATTHSGDELETGEIQEEKRPVYDPEKIIDFPGFNVPLPEGGIDESARFNMPPMQPHQSKEVLQLYFSPSSFDARKRERTEESTPRPKKRQKMEPRVEHDMELDSDSANSDGSTGVLFKPPLPSEAPRNTPPPLPSETPPGRTPKRGAADSDTEKTYVISSATNSGQNSRCTTPELEELEAKQRLLLQALEDEDDGPTDKDTDKDDGPTDKDEDIEDTQSLGNESGMSLIIGGEEFHVTDSVNEEQASLLENTENLKGEIPAKDSPVNSEGPARDRTSTSESNVTSELSTEKQTCKLISNGKSTSATIMDKQCVDSPSGSSEMDLNGTQDISQPGTPSSLTDSASKQGVVHKSLKGIPDAKNFASGISPYRPHENEKQVSGVYKKLRQIIKKIPKE
ncbi:zinc finger CCHC domain-containing protein 8-like [Glandiceps talaboti]